MDRPDIMYASKELCREFAQPRKSSVVKLKRLIRYLVHHPRLVWNFRYAKSADQNNVLDVYSDTDFGVYEDEALDFRWHCQHRWTYSEMLVEDAVHDCPVVS